MDFLSFFVKEKGLRPKSQPFRCYSTLLISEMF